MNKSNNTFDDIIDYYDQTRFDYRTVWDNSETPAVHFGYYDEKASDHKNALQNMNRVLAETIELQSGEKVLDAGCGRGGSTFWLAKNYQAEVVGICPVPSQIEECNAHRKALQLEQLTRFDVADYCNTPYEAESFDVVWACESLCHAKEKEAFYKEAFRILKPGGRLVIAEYLRNSRPLNVADEKLLKGWLNRWAILDIDTKEEHQDHLRKSGFQSFKIEDKTKNVQVSLRNLHMQSTRWIWMGWILRGLRIRSKVAHGNQVGSIKQYKALQKGIWSYHFISAIKPKG